MAKSVLDQIQREFSRGCSPETGERRKAPRRACVAPSVLVPVRPDGSVLERGRRDAVVIDVSPSGVRVISRHRFRSQKVRVRIPITGGDQAVLAGKIVRRRTVLGYREYGIRLIGGAAGIFAEDELLTNPSLLHVTGQF